MPQPLKRNNAVSVTHVVNFIRVPLYCLYFLILEGIGVRVKHHFHLTLALGIVLAVIAGFFAVDGARRAPIVINKENDGGLGERLPDMEFYNAADQKITLADFQGKVVLVNLWATWCPPCVTELPALDNLQARLKDKDFKVVTIALDRSSIATVADFLKEKGIERLEPYWDKERQIPLKWRYAGLPTTYLLDREGKVVRRFDGPRAWDKPEIVDMMLATLE